MRGTTPRFVIYIVYWTCPATTLFKKAQAKLDDTVRVYGRSGAAQRWVRLALDRYAILRDVGRPTIDEIGQSRSSNRFLHCLIVRELQVQFEKKRERISIVRHAVGDRSTTWRLLRLPERSANAPGPLCRGIPNAQE